MFVLSSFKIYLFSQSSGSVSPEYPKFSMVEHISTVLRGYEFGFDIILWSDCFHLVLTLCVKELVCRLW